MELWQQSAHSAKSEAYTIPQVQLAPLTRGDRKTCFFPLFLPLAHVVRLSPGVVRPITFDAPVSGVIIG